MIYILQKPIPWLSLILISGAVLSGCAGSGETPGDGEEQQPVHVTAITVQQTVLRPTLALTGSLIAPPERTALLSPQVPGAVAAVPVVVGQFVHAGETIVELDARLMEVERLKAVAAADEARANLALLQKGPLPAEVEASRQELRVATAATEARAAKLGALAALSEHGEVAAVQLAQAQSAVDEAEAAQRAAAERLKMLESGARPEQLDQAAAQLRLAEAERDAYTLKVALCRIAAPIDGTVTQLPARQGMYVDVLANVATIQDCSTLYARVRMPAAHLAHLAPGAAARVAVSEDSNSFHEGIVRRIAAEADAATGDVEVLVEVQNFDGELRPGLACRVTLALEEIPDALCVPPAAVADSNGETVVTVIEEGKAHQRRVQLGTQTQDQVQIKQGLAPGDVVVTAGGYALPEGRPVVLDSGLS